MVANLTTDDGTELSEEEYAASLVALVNEARVDPVAFIQMIHPATDTRYVLSLLHLFLATLFRETLAGNLAPRQSISVPPQHGKALWDEEWVPTTKGFKRNGDLKVGDMVFATDGSPTRVRAVMKWEDRQLYRLTMDDGSTVVADEAHEWPVRMCRKRKGVFTNWETRKLAERKSTRAPMLPKSGALQFPHATLRVPPYILGCWLGDGSRSGNEFTADPMDQPHFIERFAKWGFFVSDNEGSDGKTTTHFSLRGARWFRGWLRQHGLDESKHIPNAYKNASIEQRMELLRGLIDTDGHVAPDGQVEFCNTNKRLAYDTLDLVHSLGIKASMVKGRAKLNGRDCGPKWRVMFYADGVASIPRKAARLRKPKKDCRYIEKVEPCGRGATTCIEIEHPSHLYLCGKACIPTHNSRTLTVLCVAWALGRYPGISIAITAFSAQLASDFSKQIRDIISSPVYQVIFPKAAVVHGSNRMDNWRMTNGSHMIARSTGSKLTGRRVDLLIVDDPFSGREEAESMLQRERVKQWYFADCFTRLAPNSKVFLIGCMTGDTPVLMADSTEKPIRDIVPGDCVATYRNGVMSVSTVTNWINHGEDEVFAIKMSCGRVVKANKRHPFLVERKGKLQWIRLRKLRIGDKIVRALQSGEDGVVLSALTKDATNPPNARECATDIIATRGGQTASGLHRSSVKNPEGLSTYGTDTGLSYPNMTQCSKGRVGVAQSASDHQQQKTPESINGESSVLTTTTAPEKCAGCSATIAISQSLTESLPLSCYGPLNTSRFTVSRVLSISPSGKCDVFDIEVAETENFIADGLVSHNTRWHPEDLIGHLTSEDYNKEMKLSNAPEEIFTVVSLPAEAEQDDLLGRMPGEALFPEVRGTEFLRAVKAVMPAYEWASQYRNDPQVRAGGQVDLSRLHTVPMSDVPLEQLRIARGWDLAVTEKTAADFSAGALIGVLDPTAFEEEEAKKVGMKALPTIFIMDMSHLKLAWPKLKPTIITTALQDLEEYNAAIMGVEAVSGFEIGLQELTGSLYGRVKVEKKNPYASKLIRAQPWLNLVEAGRVYLVEGVWNKKFKAELAAFPMGKHDDQVDAVSIAREVLCEPSRLLIA